MKILKNSGLQWIGVSPEEYKRCQASPATQTVTAWFGLSAELEQVPESVPVRITGRSQYKLYVNGKSVIFGPLRGRAEQAFVDTPDIAAFLQPGLNRLLIQAMSYPSRPSEEKYLGPSNCYADDGGPAVAVSGRLGETDLSRTENWCAVLDDGMDFSDYQNGLIGATEMPSLSRRQELMALLEQGCPAAPQAVELERESANFTGERLGRRFEERPIPPLSRREREFADCWACDAEGRAVRPEQRPQACVGGFCLHAAPHTTLHYAADAGELTTAFPLFALSGGKGGRVRITYAECYLTEQEGKNPDKIMRDNRDGIITGVYDEVKLSGKEEIYEPFRLRTFRFIRVDITAEDEGIDLTLLPFVESAYPLVNDKRPAFTDPKKEKLYDVALRTLQLCMHDTYEDCPYYEQLQYASDSRLEILFTYSASSDTRLPEYAISLFATSLLPDGLTQARFPSQKLQVITGFALYFILMLEDYVKATGNAQKMAEYIPVAERIIETFLAHRTENGLIAARGYAEDCWEFWDWTREWNRGGTPTAILECGVSTLENLVFVYTVQSLCRILPLYHRGGLAEYYLDEADKLQRTVKETCWDAEKGLFREAPGFNEYSQHSQIFAVLTGLVKGEEAAALMEKVLSDKSLVQCSFVQRFYLFRALEMTGMYDRTEELWTDWQHMVDLHCTTFPETPEYPRSECHAWSSLPLYEMARKQ